LLRPASLRLDLPGLGITAAIGLFVLCAQSWCFFSAVERIPVATAVLILYGYPAVVTLGSVAMGHMRLDWKVGAAVILVSLGCGLVCSDAVLHDLDSTGLIFAFGAMLLLSLNLLLIQLVMPGRPPLGVTAYMLAGSLLGFFLLYGGDPLLSVPGSALPVAIALGLLPTALSIALLFLAIERIGSGLASIGSSVEPVAAAVLAWAILGEPLGSWQLFGAACIVAGIVIPNLSALKRIGPAQT
jgi:drug/metabolite transporter (DMT)-like permease